MFCEVVVVAQKTNGNDVDNSCDTQVGHVREVEGNEKDESNSNEKLDNEDGRRKAKAKQKQNEGKAKAKQRQHKRKVKSKRRQSEGKAKAEQRFLPRSWCGSGPACGQGPAGTIEILSTAPVLF